MSSFSLVESDMHGAAGKLVTSDSLDSVCVTSEDTALMIGEIMGRGGVYVEMDCGGDDLPNGCPIWLTDASETPGRLAADFCGDSGGVTASTSPIALLKTDITYCKLIPNHCHCTKFGSSVGAVKITEPTPYSV